MIDPVVWRVYSIMFPMLAIVCLLIAGILLVESGSLACLLNSEQAETFSILYIFYIGCMALMGWISLVLLLRTNITAMGATVDR